MSQPDELTPAVDWEKARLQKEWSLWNPEEKETYLYWFDLAKDLETEDLQAARFCAHKVLEKRRRDGIA